MHYIALILYVACFIVKDEALKRSEHHETLLHNYLFGDYNVNVRPVLNQSDQILVTLRLSLRKIQDLDEKGQSLKTTVNLELYWKDEFLTWNMSEFGGISTLVIPYDKNIWIPDIMIYNALEKPDYFGMEGSVIQLYNDGQIYAWTQAMLNTECEIKSKKYPLDEQTCSIVFSKFMNTDEKVLLQSQTNNALLIDYQHTAEWDIINDYVTRETFHFNVSIDVLTYTFITYHFKVKRACRLCLFNFIIPVLILATLNLASFFVPCDSGEKTSFPISIFLTMAVFLTMITRALPESVDGVSYLSSYVTFLLAIGAITTLCSATALQIHFRSNSWPVSRLACFLVKVMKCGACKENEEMDKQREQLDSHKQDEDLQFKNKNSNEQMIPKVTWQQVSHAFDRLMFYLIFLCEIISTGIFLDLIVT